MKKRILYAFSSLKVTLPISIGLLILYALGLIIESSDYLPAPHQLIILVLALFIPPITIILRLVVYSRYDVLG